MGLLQRSLALPPLTNLFDGLPPGQHLYLTEPPPGSDSDHSLFLDLVFGVTRGRLVGAEGPVAKDATTTGSVLSFRVPRSPASPPEVQVQSEQEHVELVKIFVRGTDGAVLRVFAPRPCGRGYRSYAPGWSDWEEVSAAVTPASHLDALSKALGYPGPPPDTTTRFQRCFAATDRQTNAHLLPRLVELGELHQDAADMRKMRLGAIAQQLRQRVVQRARKWRPGARDLVLPVIDVSLWKPKLERISSLLLGIIDQHCPQDFDAAFESFANGELRKQLPSLAWTTQPSSGLFFLFGEFALMACDYDVDRGRWEAHCRAMVRTQRIFCQVYGPEDKAGANYFAYGAWHYGCAGLPYSKEKKDALRREFEGKDHVELCTAAAQHAAENLPGLL